MAVHTTIIEETYRPRPGPPRGAGAFDGGVRAGLFAGLVMALAGMFVSAATGAGFWTPMRLLAAGVLGVNALIGGFGVVLLGLALHFAVAAFWGVIFTALVDRDLAADRALAAGLVYGAAVWAVMTYGALPLLDRTMLPRVRLAPGTWLVMHLVYGVCLWRAPELKWRYGGPGAVRARETFIARRETANF
jgi:hypothetical protein